jgi:hypothetical protein
MKARTGARSRQSSVARIILGNILVFLILLTAIEAVGLIVKAMHPVYDVLYLQPDRVVGWKQVPNLRWTWTGHYWYAADFSVPVQTNAMGFRDLPRSVSKPADVRRIALLGDSFIEAVQVPLERTAGQVLERTLNNRSRTRGTSAGRWEVLNFGISNHGIGQYLLTLEEYVRSYAPDYVAIFVAGYLMERTVAKYEFSWRFKKSLWIRPTFRLEGEKLIREPARDFQDFEAWQQRLIRTDYAGQRSRRRHSLITTHIARESRERLGLLLRGTPTLHPDVLGVNLKIIEEIKRVAAAGGSELALLDVSEYFGDDPAVSGTLREFCSKAGIAYVPVFRALLSANRNGVRTSWNHDSHFNEAGNEILADTLFQWMTTQPDAPQR